MKKQFSAGPIAAAIVFGFILALLLVSFVRAAEPEKAPTQEISIQALTESRNIVVKELNDSFLRFKKLESTYNSLDAEIQRRQEAEKVKATK